MLNNFPPQRPIQSNPVAELIYLIEKYLREL